MLVRREVFKEYFKRFQFRLNETEDSVESFQVLLLELHKHAQRDKNRSLISSFKNKQTRCDCLVH